MKKLEKIGKFYNKKYFQQRDLLSPHLANSIKFFAQNHGLKKVLDVGCGTGRLVKFFNDNGFEAIGCDNFDQAVKFARQINKINTIYEASATKLPFKNETLDLVTAISVIEHLTKSEAKKFIAEATRVLRKGGFIFLVTPNFTTIWRFIQGRNWFGFRDPTHINFYTPKSLTKLLQDARFQNIKLNFKVKYQESFNWEFPSFFAKLPKFAKIILIFLLFSTPLSFLRNSFWISAKK